MKSSNRPKVLMIVENYFPSDPRVRKEAYSLKDKYKIDIIALKKKGQPFFETWEDISVLRLPEFKFKRLPKLQYIFQYTYVTLTSLLIFLMLMPFKRYKIIHVHNPPDTFFLVGAIGRLFGARFIFDLHDLAPELYLSRFKVNPGFIYRCLIMLEGYSCQVANTIICTNESYKKLVCKRHNQDPNKVFIVRNDPIIDDFLIHRDEEYSKNGNIIVFLGAINPQDGVDHLLQAIHILTKNLGKPQLECRIIGDGDAMPLFRKIVAELEIENNVIFTGFVNDTNEIRNHLKEAAIGVEPAMNNPLNQQSTFIKVMEYMAASLPIVAYDLAESRFSADDAAIYVEPDNVTKLAQAISDLLDSPVQRKEMGKVGLERVNRKLNWTNSEKILFNAYNASP